MLCCTCTVEIAEAAGACRAFLSHFNASLTRASHDFLASMVTPVTRQKSTSDSDITIRSTVQAQVP